MLLLKQRGVGLIEVLVTILVIAVGLLGLVGMQMASMKNINNAHHRSLATIAAYDMVERMRTNPAGVTAGSYNAVAVNKSTTDCGDSCSSEAARDVSEWAVALEDSFPDGFAGSVTSNGNFHDITVSWTELQVDSETPANAPDFTLRVKVYAP